MFIVLKFLMWQHLTQRFKQKCTAIKLILTKKWDPIWFCHCHNKNFKATNILCLLINIMLIIIFVLTYAYFPIFVSAYCNVMFATIKKEKMKIKLYFW